MGKASRRRQLTGCIRRGTKRTHSSYRRAMHLSHADVGYRHILQNCIAFHGGAAYSALRFIPVLVVLSLLIQYDVISPNIPNIGIAINTLTLIQQAQYVWNQSRFVNLLRRDHEYFDIPIEEEEAAPSHRMPRQHIRFNSWSNQECYENTNFTKQQLRRIYDCFGLATLAAQQNGYIRVQNFGNAYHLFHPEELFLFMMTRCKTGYTNKHLSEYYFGGHQSRWSYGYRWILEYLDERYANILGHQGLSRFVNRFPQFYDAIQKKVGRVKTKHYNDNRAQDFSGLHFLPFDIAFFIDCSIYRICRPFSGPAGDFIGAPRKERYYNAQRAFYSRYIKGHGIKVETILLPNGLSTVYGPVSCRPHDVGGVLQMSGLDRFLFNIQRNKEHMYLGFGDGAYGANGLRCIRSYFRAFGPGAQLTVHQETCNDRMKSVRENIEHNYGEIFDLFQLTTDKRNFKLGKQNPYAQEQLRVCHLLTNIYNCLNGDKSSGYQMFDCHPPSLEKYLSLTPVMH